jgi:hypothetical protein
MSRASFYSGVAVGGSLVLSALSIRWLLYARNADDGSECRPVVSEALPVLRLLCCLCGHSHPVSAFQSKQARRRDDQRKCRACVDAYKSGPLPAQRAATLEANKALHRFHMAAHATRAAAAEPKEHVAATVAPSSTADADSIDDPLRLARKAETVLRSRTDRMLLVLEDCSDDFNVDCHHRASNPGFFPCVVERLAIESLWWQHVAVLRTCEALGVMRVWLVETAGRRTKNAYVQPSASAAAPAAGADPATVRVAPSRAQRQLETRCAQRGFEYDRMLGLRRAQLFAAHLDVRTFATTSECIRAARDAGRELWVTDMAQDSIALSSDTASVAAQLPPYVAVVMGSEASGVSEEMLDAADRRIFLPM